MDRHQLTISLYVATAVALYVYGGWFAPQGSRLRDFGPKALAIVGAIAAGVGVLMLVLELGSHFATTQWAERRTSLQVKDWADALFPIVLGVLFLTHALILQLRRPPENGDGGN